MRIVQLVTDLQLGGTPLRLARLAVGLRARGVDVHVGCLGPPGPVSAELAAADVPTFACEARVSRDVRALWRLERHVRRIAPDLIHATLTHANVAARLVGVVRHIPVVGSTATIEIERRWHLRLERLTAWLDRLHVVNSRALAEHVQRAFGLPQERVVVVPPAVRALPMIDRAAARGALGLGTDEFVVAWVGRLDPVKHVGLVVDAAEHLADVAAVFVLAGDGPEEAALRRRVAGSAATGRVRLLGWRADVGTVLAAADAFLFPSLTEGLPNAVLEAMWAGLPVVASDIPALRELAGLPGARVPPAAEEPCHVPAVGRLWLVSGDRADRYAAALRTLRSDPAAGRTLGSRAAAWVRAHASMEAAVQGLIETYERAIGLTHRAETDGGV